MFEIREGGSRGLGGGKGYKRVGPGLSVCLSACLAVCPVCLSTCLSVPLPVCLSPPEREIVNERETAREDKIEGGGEEGGRLTYYFSKPFSCDMITFIFITHIRNKFYFPQPLCV